MTNSYWYAIIPYSPGHDFTLHERVFFLIPTQSFPPWATGGLVQVRERVWVPLSQVVLHWDQFCHEDQLPSTAEKRKDNLSFPSKYHKHSQRKKEI